MIMNNELDPTHQIKSTILSEPMPWPPSFNPPSDPEADFRHLNTVYARLRAVPLRGGLTAEHFLVPSAQHRRPSVTSRCLMP